MSYLNPGNGMFQESLKSKIYVDKSGLIKYTNSILSTRQKYVCVSRPRRFGKSYAADMLKAYYGRGCDSHSQFDGLEISKNPDYEKHINKYNVIHVDVSGYMKSFSSNATIIEILDRLYSKITSELKKEYPDVVIDKDNTLSDYLLEIYETTKIPFVFIIDEWDAIFRNRKDDFAGQREYLNRLESLLKGREYVALAYMTGILPIKKYGTHSALNMFKEISMTNANPLEKYIGFTEAEVRKLCEEYGKSESDIAFWYNGYTVNGIRVYNPYAVSEAVQSRGPLHGYWTQTETYEALEIYIRTNTYGVQDVLVDLIDGKPVEVKTEGFANDMTTLTCCDDVLTLLIHLGYLTMSRDEGKSYVSIPNHEIKEQFLSSMKRIGLGNPDSVLPTSEIVLDATLRGDSKTVAEYVELIHQERTSILDYNEEISLKYVIQFAYVAAESRYSMVREMPAGKGYADVAFIPLENNPSYPPMVVELKVRGPKGGAVTQATKKEYFRFLKSYHGDVVLVGIHYDKKSKRHTCRIKRVKV